MKVQTMDISSISNAASVVAIDAHPIKHEASLLVLKKALQMEETAVSELLGSLPTDLPLATSGSLGTQLNLLV